MVGGIRRGKHDTRLRMRQYATINQACALHCGIAVRDDSSAPLRPINPTLSIDGALIDRLDQHVTDDTGTQHLFRGFHQLGLDGGDV